MMTILEMLPAMSHCVCDVPLQDLCGKRSKIDWQNTQLVFVATHRHPPGRMSEIWIQCFSCCVTDEPPPKRRHRIDRSMIGNPTNFRHTGHVGSGDMNIHLNTLQHQMASKGGYDYALPVNVQIPVVDVKN